MGCRLAREPPSGDYIAAQAHADCTSTSFPSADVPKTIPSPGVAESERTVAGAGAVHDLNVELEVSHPFDSDLTLEIVAPSGESATLADGVGTWGGDFTGTTFDDEAGTSVISAFPPFTGSFRPWDPLTELEGGTANGTWKLRVEDRHGGYDGTLDAWSLEIGTCTDPPATPPRPAGAPVLPPIPAGVPAGAEETVGTVVTVGTNSDAADGDTTKAARNAWLNRFVTGERGLAGAVV